jgi:hypothetical protein
VAGRLSRHSHRATVGALRAATASIRQLIG